MKPIQPCFDEKQLEFEESVYNELKELLQVTRSDAQGIEMCCDIEMGDMYRQGLTPFETAQAIDKATRIN